MSRTGPGVGVGGGGAPRQERHKFRLRQCEERVYQKQPYSEACFLEVFSINKHKTVPKS